MDTILNMKAFLATARSGSFSEAARQLSVAPSVVSKRVNQLEWQLRARLLERTTRRVRLTEVGEQYLPTVRGIVTEYEDLVTGIQRSPGELEGHIRVKAPSALTRLHLGKVFTAFQQANARVTLEVVLIDRSVNPIEEGFDVVLSVLPSSYEGVAEEALLAYPRVACASPAYLKQRGEPKHPRDLASHDCLVFQPAGTTWTFQSRRAPISVSVRPKFSSNDIQVIVVRSAGRERNRRSVEAHREAGAAIRHARAGAQGVSVARSLAESIHSAKPSRPRTRPGVAQLHPRCVRPNSALGNALIAKIRSFAIYDS